MPNGLYINVQCGSTYPSKVKSAVKKFTAHVGHLLMEMQIELLCDEKGKIIDGDQIIAMLAKGGKEKILKGGVISTLMSN